jgi:hypothetical protein
MSVSRNIIDAIYEEKEQASVKVELIGSPSSVQKALRQLARDKGKKLAKAAAASVDPEKVQVGADKDDEGKGKEEKDDKSGKKRLPQRPKE